MSGKFMKDNKYKILYQMFWNKKKDHLLTVRHSSTERRCDDFARSRGPPFSMLCFEVDF